MITLYAWCDAAVIMTAGLLAVALWTAGLPLLLCVLLVAPLVLTLPWAGRRDPIPVPRVEAPDRAGRRTPAGVG